MRREYTMSVDEVSCTLLRGVRATLGSPFLISIQINTSFIICYVARRQWPTEL